MKIRAADVASLVFVLGVVAQGFGAYDLGGVGWAAAIVGTELAALGLMGVLRHAG